MEKNEGNTLKEKIEKREQAEKKRRKEVYKSVLIIVVLLIIVDQLTKITIASQSVDIIPGILRFTLIENTGGAFGVGQNSTFSFIVANIVVLGIIIKFIGMQANQIDKKTIFGLSLVLAGGISNLVDRLVRGFVVDFIDFSPIVKFPVFNIADIYIVLGWILLALFFAIYATKTRKIKIEEEKDDKIE